MPGSITKGEPGGWPGTDTFTLLTLFVRRAKKKECNYILICCVLFFSSHGGEWRFFCQFSEVRRVCVDGVIDGGVEVGGVDVSHGEAGVVGMLADGEGVEACVDEICQPGITERV